MNISAPFITRPIATTLLILGITLLGLVAYILLPIAGVPQVDIPTIQITADLPGANADTMATSVATPIERQLAFISGVNSISSSSSLGHTSIQVEFDLSRSVDSAAQDVQTALNAAGGDLPKSMPAAPTYEKVNPADAQLVSIAVWSDDLPIAKVDDYVETYLARQLSRLPGVGLVDFHGEQKPAVRVQVNPAALASIGLSLEEVRGALASATVNAPKGTLDGLKQALTLDTTDQLFEAAAFKDTIIAYRQGAPVRIRDIGTAVDSVEDIRQAAWLKGRRAIVIDVHKQPGYNINATVQLVKDALPDLQRNLPPSVRVELLGDRTQVIHASVNDVQFTMAISIALVVLVVFLFLRHLSATIIPSITIPVSLLATCTVMYVAGYTIDNVSLMALTISVGFIIDDAIVMVENIVRHIEAGETPVQAALKGSAEIGFTIVSMTLSLIAVFIPLLLMGGLIGRLFHEFAVSASIAILMSGLVSLTLTPMMCGQFLHAGKPREGWLGRMLEAAFTASLRVYDVTLRAALRHHALVMLCLIATIGGTVYLYRVIPKGFFPQQDGGTIIASTEAAQDISFQAMSSRQMDMMQLIAKDPDVETVYGWIGANPTVNSGRIMISLTPFNQRQANAQQVVARLRKQAQSVMGLGLFLVPRQDVQIGARVSKTQYQYTLQDPNIAELFVWAPQILARMKTLPQLQDVTADLQPSAPRMTLQVDRNRLGRFGITPQVVDDTLYDAFGQRQVATIFSQLDQHHVVLEVDPQFQGDSSALDRLYVRSGLGAQMVPLSMLVKYETSVAPLTINHQDQFPSVTLSFNLAPGHSLGDAIDAIHGMELTMAKPAALTARYQGSAKVFENSLGNQPYLIAAAVLAVYIVLGMLYESFIHPITILSTLPSAGVGALLALMFLGYDFSLIALIGVILLVGIVKKNAIMMIDFALDRERGQGMSPREAIYQACLLRFRPIMMTTMAALLGALPLALGTGAGSELRRPLGIAIVGGLLLSQFLTLYTTPVIYLYLSKLERKPRKWRQAAQRSAPQPEVQHGVSSKG